MRIRKGYLAATALAAMLLFMSACSSIGGGSSTTAGQVIQNSINAMKQLKTAHVDMNFSDSIQMSGFSTPTTSSSTPTSITLSMKGSGDEVMPDQTSMHFTLNAAGLGQNSAFAEIVKGKKLYIQNAKGQWYVLDMSALKGSSTGNLFSGLNASQYNNLITLAQKAKFDDHGDETLNGQSLRHITVTFGKDVLKDLLNTLGQSPTAANQQALNNLMDKIHVQKAVLDLWIDEGTSYVHRLEMKFNISVDTGPFVTPATTSHSSGSVSTNLDATVDYSKFNDPVTITAPANAIPTTNPLAGFEGA